jgi:hypothetical protein
LTKVCEHYSLKCFNCLPVAAIIDRKIFCCHGGKTSFFSHSISTYTSLLSEGLSPELHSLEQIRKITRPTDVPDCGKNVYNIQQKFLEKAFLLISNRSIWSYCSYIAVLSQTMSFALISDLQEQLKLQTRGFWKTSDDKNLFRKPLDIAYV